MSMFYRQIVSLSELKTSKISKEATYGFYNIPIHQLFATFLARVVVQDCITNPKFVAQTVNLCPDENIYYQALLKSIGDEEQAQTLLD